MLFLGTGAAEMLPNPYCTCPLCENARLHPEERRRRTSFLYDRETLIDCGPDTLSACHALNISLSGLQNVLFTHLHEDHFCLANLNVITMSSTSGGKPFTCHVSRAGWEHLCRLRQAVLAATNGHNDLLGAVERGFYSFQAHDAFETFRLGEKTVFTVRGNHNAEGPGERSLHYRVTEKGRTLLYALDGGLYEPESLEALSGFPVDVLIMDATFGSADLPLDSGHLNGAHFLLQLESLAKAGVVTEKTRVYAAHINHKHGWTHALYQRFFDENSKTVPVTVARDGLEVTL